MHWSRLHYGYFPALLVFSQCFTDSRLASFPLWDRFKIHSRFIYADCSSVPVSVGPHNGLPPYRCVSGLLSLSELVYGCSVTLQMLAGLFREYAHTLEP